MIDRIFPKAETKELPPRRQAVLATRQRVNRSLNDIEPVHIAG